MIRTIATAAFLAASGAAFAGESAGNALTESESWNDIRYDVVGDTDLVDAGTFLAMKAPYRAHDAATVPIVLTQTDPSRIVTGATVVIDENPAPVAGTFTFSEAMAPLDFELRVRVDQYSNVRVIAETEDGLAMTGRFVKASGGCSAPASRDPVAALASMGEMKLRSFLDADAPKMSPMRRETQIMIRHPNYSGLQRDQISQLFIPAHFIDTLEVWQGDEMLFAMDGGISIAENPVFRFSYADNGATALTVRATDTEGNSFEEVLPKDAAS